MIIDILILNTWLLGALILASFFDRNAPSATSKAISAGKSSVLVSPAAMITACAISMLLALSLISFAPLWIVRSYMTLLLSFSVIGGSIWITQDRSLTNKCIAIVLSIGLIIARFYSNSPIIHNLFIIGSVIWLGTFLTKMELLNQKRFIILSIIWFLYDSIFVWLSPLATTIINTTETIQLPLSIVSGDLSLGTGDLLWASMLLAVTNPKLHLKLIAILVISNVTLGIMALSTGLITLFPLLVLWIPLTFLYLHRQHQFKAF